MYSAFPQKLTKVHSRRKVCSFWG